jgi:hypothetical protein
MLVLHTPSRKAVRRTPPQVEKLRRLEEELAVLDGEIAHHRREIKDIKEARKDVEAELHRLIQPREA